MRLLRCPAFYMAWLAAWHGGHDGRRFIPNNGPEAGAPEYLAFLCRYGTAKLGGVAYWFSRADVRLSRTYCRRAVQYAQVSAALARARAAEQAAGAAYDARPHKENLALLKSCRAQAARALRASERAELRLHQAVDRRHTVHRQALAELGIISELVSKLMHVYARANVAARRDHEAPPALHAAAGQPIPKPALLERLEWDPPLTMSLAGRGSQAVPAET